MLEVPPTASLSESWPSEARLSPGLFEIPQLNGNNRFEQKMYRTKWHYMNRMMKLACNIDFVACRFPRLSNFYRWPDCVTLSLNLWISYDITRFPRCKPNRTHVVMSQASVQRIVHAFAVCRMPSDFVGVLRGRSKSSADFGCLAIESFGESVDMDLVRREFWCGLISEVYSELVKLINSWC